MTALVITLTSVAAWFVGWFYTARYRVELWQRRGDKILGSSMFTSRRFSRPEDRGWIAWYALISTCVWPVILPMMIMSNCLFARIDRREVERRETRRRREAEIETWRVTLRNPDATEVERRVAAEVLRGLGESVR